MDMKKKNVKIIISLLVIISLSHQLFAQTKDSDRNYTFAISSSIKGNIVYISTVFCWKCTPNHPCNGVVYGKNEYPCEFLVKWALSVFKNKQQGFDGKEATVNCVTESLSMYNYSSEQDIEKHRNEVIDNYKSKLHKTVIIVSFPLCME